MPFGWGSPVESKWKIGLGQEFRTATLGREDSGRGGGARAGRTKCGEAAQWALGVWWVSEDEFTEWAGEWRMPAACTLISSVLVFILCLKNLLNEVRF